MKSRYTNTRHGFSLIEMLVALGIGSIVVATLSAVIVKILASQNIIESRQDLVTLVGDIQATLSDREACELALGTIAASPNFDLSLASKSKDGFPFQMRMNNELIQSTAQLSSFKINVDKFEMVNAAFVGNDLSNQPVYQADLLLQASPANSALGGLKDFKPRHTGRAFFTVIGGKVASCSTTSPLDQEKVGEMCSGLGGSYNVATKECEIVPQIGSQEISTICSAFGGQFGGGKCNLPVPAPVIVAAQPVSTGSSSTTSSTVPVSQPTTGAMQCPSGQMMTGISASGGPICQTAVATTSSSTISTTTTPAPTPAPSGPTLKWIKVAGGKVCVGGSATPCGAVGTPCFSAGQTCSYLYSLEACKLTCSP